jgi:uncharacterized membrane protein YsdA (DUF1294 family)
MELTIYQIIILFIFSLINIFAFIYMGIDKARAISNKRRIKEAHLLFLAICFCAFGVLLGMLVFRHKIRKFYFFIGVPIALIENLSVLFVINYYILKIIL